MEGVEVKKELSEVEGSHQELKQCWEGSPELRIDSTGPDYVVRSLEDYLVGTEYCDLSIVCANNNVLQAHCAVISAVSDFMAAILREARRERDKIQLHLPDVAVEYLQSFLELVYTGCVRIEEDYRPEFLQLLKFLEVYESVQEVANHNLQGGLHEFDYDEFQEAKDDLQEVSKPIQISANQCFVRKDEEPIVTNQCQYKSKPKAARRPSKPKSRKRRLNEDGGGEATVKEELDLEDDQVREVQVEFCDPLEVDFSNYSKPLARDQLKVNGSAVHKKEKKEKPPVASLLAHLEAEAECAEEKLKADMATKAWLQTSSVQIPQMVTDMNGCQVLARVDARTNSAVAGTGRKCEKCRCPLCLDGKRILSPGESAVHLCHYPTCGKVYKKTSHLRAHLRWHIGDQPYPCSWPSCGKRFTRSDELHRHFRIHTGEKKHKCEVCERSFSRSDHLKKHMLSHHPDGDNTIEIDPTQILEVESYMEDEVLIQ